MEPQEESKNTPSLEIVLLQCDRKRHQEELNSITADENDGAKIAKKQDEVEEAVYWEINCFETMPQNEVTSDVPAKIPKIKKHRRSLISRPSILRRPTTTAEEAKAIKLSTIDWDAAGNPSNSTKYIPAWQMFDKNRFHEYSPYAMPVFRCFYCKDSFFAFSQTKQHIWMKHKVAVMENNWSCQIWRCQSCQSESYYKENLLIHITSMHCVQYKCIASTMNFEYIGREFMLHLDALRMVPKLCQSKYCDFVSSNVDALKKHEHEHRLAGGLVCHKCSLVFRNSDVMNLTIFQQHLSSHAHKSHRGTFTCNTCEFITFDYNLLENHRTYEPNHPHTCPGCQEEFENLEDLVKDHFPFCLLLYKENTSTMDPSKSICEKFTEVDQDAESRFKIKVTIPPSNSGQATKPMMDYQLEFLLDKRFSLSLDALGELLVCDKNCCRTCRQEINSVSDMFAHFLIHFSPCCKFCSVQKSRVCNFHGKWYFLKSNLYFDKFSQHSFVKMSMDEMETLKCKNCDIIIKNTQVVTYTTSFVRCSQCSYFETAPAALFHILQHNLWKKCHHCGFLSASTSIFSDHIRACNQEPSPPVQCKICKPEMCKDAVTHEQQCKLVLMKRIKQVDTNACMKTQLLNICKPYIATSCGLCGEKFYSQNALEVHMQNHPTFQCHLCYLFVPSVMKHYIDEHSDFCEAFQDSKDLLAVKTDIKSNAELHKVMARCASMEHEDLFCEILQDRVNNSCIVCKEPIKSTDEALGHFLLHFSPCCTDCSNFPENKCAVHKKPILIHQTNYLCRITQHDFWQMESQEYRCKKCKFEIDENSGGAIFSKFMLCPECNFFVTTENKHKLVSHIMHHFALVLCSVDACDKKVLPPEEYKVHISTEHNTITLACSCLLKFTNKDDLRKHMANCRIALVDLFILNVPAAQDTLGRMKIMLEKKLKKCNLCYVDHPSGTKSRAMHHPNIACPICEKVVEHIEFEMHFIARHEDFINNVKTFIKIDNSPEANLVAVKEMWRKWLDNLSKLHEIAPMDQPKSERADYEIAMPEITELELPANCTKFEVTAVEYEKILELSFQKITNE